MLCPGPLPLVRTATQGRPLTKSDLAPGARVGPIIARPPTDGTALPGGARDGTGPRTQPEGGGGGAYARWGGGGHVNKGREEGGGGKDTSPGLHRSPQMSVGLRYAGAVQQRRRRRHVGGTVPSTSGRALWDTHPHTHTHDQRHNNRQQEGLSAQISSGAASTHGVKTRHTHAHAHTHTHAQTRASSCVPPQKIGMKGVGAPRFTPTPPDRPPLMPQYTPAPLHQMNLPRHPTRSVRHGTWGIGAGRRPSVRACQGPHPQTLSADGGYTTPAVPD